MAVQCCVTCGRAFKAPKKTPITPELNSQASAAERFAYFKKTAPVEDVRFALRAGVKMSPALRDDWQALLGLAPTLARGETYKRLTVLQGRWRLERNRLELEKRFAWDVARHVRLVYLPLRLSPDRLVA